ncbi:hypothetical protein PG996_009110 [Apiospora saccharicola]|uniref:Mid2 domain-containing protein n=1 Tax=Apiospora saccharicola TaxID=335842 RepID=A0ABR1UM81_9PEZI
MGVTATAFVRVSGLDTSIAADVQIKLGGAAALVFARMTKSFDLLHICPDKSGMWCCNRAGSSADCCSEGKGIMWNNATLVNYALERRQTEYTFELTGASTAGLPTTAASSIGPRIAASPSSSSLTTATPSTITGAPVPAPTYACSSTPGVAVAAGLGVGLGVPLLAVSAVLLWMLAKQRYHRSQSATSTHQEAQRKTIVSTQQEPEAVKYEIAEGQRTWNKPELSAYERRMVAELN